MRPTIVRNMRPTVGRMMGFVNRPNHVPQYQKMFQEGEKNHVRQWNQTSRSKYFMYPYWVGLWGCTAGTLYMMGRLVLGHKTWFGKG